MATTMLLMGEPTTSSQVEGAPTRRELAVLALVLAVVVGSVLLLVVASGQVAAALSTPS